jgi:C4-dicarboxylate transporter DctM subunit
MAAWAGRRAGLRAVCRGVGLVAGHGGGHRLHPPAGHGRQGFPSFGAGVITTSGALGILIPPSIVMVMYSVATNTSVGALFMAGVVPGLLLAFLLGLTTWYWRARTTTRACQGQGRALEAFRKSGWGLLLIVIVMGGIYTGIFTPTEAAAMAAVYAFIAVFVYKDMG